MELKPQIVLCEATNRIVISEFKANIMVTLPETYYPSEQCYEPFTMMSGITHFLTNWCLELPKPLIVFIDEVDAREEGKKQLKEYIFRSFKFGFRLFNQF